MVTIRESPFLFQHDCSSVHNASSIKAWFDEFGVKEVVWLERSPDLRYTEHLGSDLGANFMVSYVTRVG